LNQADGLTGSKRVHLIFLTMAAKPQPIAVETPEENQTGYEQKNVHEVYEVIATHFSDTRYKVYIATFLLKSKSADFLIRISHGQL
jgi:hypothetical protein